ncbi:MAG: hypothetical protein ACI828_002905 [Flavobacteriales bacterium]|jgi:hypothetical protein
MKNLSVLLLLTSTILFGSCAEKTDAKVSNLESDNVKTVIESDDVKTISIDTVQPQIENDYLTIEAQFIEFYLGDASHFNFVDESGTTWDFSGCNSTDFEFERLLATEEINSDNQGWGSNKELQDKWFKISYSMEEREQYIDGPMATVKIIQEAELIDKVASAANTNTNFTLESTIMNEPIEGFVYSGNESPDGTVELQTEQMDPTSYTVAIKSGGISKTVTGVDLSPIKNYWSENNKYVVLDNADTYAGSGTFSLLLLNVVSAAYVSIDIAQLMEGVDPGDREMLSIKNVVWLNDKSFFVEAYVSYLGYSGHPGIDDNLKTKLGDNFANTDDIITLPIRKFTIN